MKPKILLAVNINRENYIKAVIGCGADCEAKYCPDMSTDYDGLLLCGGSDISPEYYGEEINGSVDIDYNRDKTEITLAKEFIRLQKPIFGICRGHQLINVLFGGSLIQHIDNADLHKGPDGIDAVHGIIADENSFLHEMYGKCFSSNSMHHQAVKDVGKGLRIMGKADDGFGTIEALEHETLPIFSVQWHPERMCFDKARSDTVDGRYLIEKFVKMCK